MMDAALKAWAEVVKRIFPDLEILRDRSQWQAGQYTPPAVYIETDLVSDAVYRPQANRIVEDVGLVFHYDIDRVSGESQGEPIPLDLNPFFLYLRQVRYQIVSKRFDIYMVAEPPRTRPLRDRVEVTIRYSYLLHVPKLQMKENGQPLEKMNEIYIDFNGKELEA